HRAGAVQAGAGHRHRPARGRRAAADRAVAPLPAGQHPVGSPRARRRRCAPGARRTGAGRDGVSPADTEVRHGLTIPLHAHTLGEHGDIVREAEALGYTDLWSFETAAIDGFSPLVFAACHSTRARLGTAIVSSFTRGPALLAMSATACEQAAPGRFIL